MIESIRTLVQNAGHTDIWDSSVQKRMSISDMDNVMDMMVGTGSPTWTGVQVTQQNAMRLAAVWSCVSILSDDLATLPLLTYRRGENGRYLATDHYLWGLLQHQANPEMTSWRFKQLMQAWLLLWGNAYAEIQISGRGQVTALWPWRPDRVKINRLYAGGPLMYSYRIADGKYVTLPQERVLHVRGLSLDGLTGMSPIEMHRQTVGYSMAVREHGARVFGNGAVPLGVLESPEALNDRAISQLRESWMAQHGGLNNSHRLAILEQGLKYHEVGLSMVDAQYIESQNLSTRDIGRIYKVPPHRLGDLTESTNNNIEQQALEYVLYSMGPWASNWESELDYSLLSPRERDSIFTKFNFRGMLRGDMAAQAAFYPAMVGARIMRPNEAREDLDLNPDDSPLADTLWGNAGSAPLSAGPTAFGTKGGQQQPEPQPPKGPQQKVNGIALQ